MTGSGKRRVSVLLPLPPRIASAPLILLLTARISSHDSGLPSLVLSEPLKPLFEPLAEVTVAATGSLATEIRVGLVVAPAVTVTAEVLVAQDTLSQLSQVVLLTLGAATTVSVSLRLFDEVFVTPVRLTVFVRVVPAPFGTLTVTSRA
ncbi:hypothetical protein ACXXDK_17145 (plasmid) [Deinococcus sp. PESE-38]